MNHDFLEIIRYATKAPSGHNTQPWRFSFEESTISIKPNLEVALPVVDGGNRELYISLGCATENLLIATPHFGYTAHIVRSDAAEITVELCKSNAVIEDSLFYQIERRQTNWSVYNGRKIANNQLEVLQSIRHEDNIHVYFHEIGSPFADTLTQYIARGNGIQMSDGAFREELLSWMRFNKMQVKKRGDGLSYKIFGSPSLPEIIAKPIVRLFLKPDPQNQSDLKKITSSSHFVLFTTKYNTVEEWIELGQLLQRFLLAATELGIASAFCNQPCEVASLATELQNIPELKGEYPTLILRIGYAHPMPFSPRKKLDEVIEYFFAHNVPKR